MTWVHGLSLRGRRLGLIATATARGEMMHHSLIRLNGGWLGAGGAVEYIEGVRRLVEGKPPERVPELIRRAADTAPEEIAQRAARKEMPNGFLMIGMNGGIHGVTLSWRGEVMREWTEGGDSWAPYGSAAAEFSAAVEGFAVELEDAPHVAAVLKATARLFDRIQERCPAAAVGGLIQFGLLVPAYPGPQLTLPPVPRRVLLDTDDGELESRLIQAGMQC